MPHLQPLTQVIGALLALLGAFMVVPALLDWADGNAGWRIFALSAAVTSGTGLLLFASSRQSAPAALKLKEAFLLTSLVWIILPIFAAIPFLALRLSFADALFEAVSGLTTTGGTVLVGLDQMPRGILLWRALMQFIGGIGMIVMAMLLLPFLGIGGMQLFRAESSDRSEKVLARSSDLVGWIAGVYCTLTVACALAYAAAGMSLFDAISHAMTTVSTGGFGTHDSQFAYFDSAVIEWIAVVFMIAGALPFTAYIAGVRGNPGSFRDPQIGAFLKFLAAASLLTALWLTLTSGMPIEDSLRYVTFSVVSIVTTTGFSSVDYMLWGPFAASLFLVLTFIGGCTGSTTGAIKIYRFIILGQVIKRQFRRLTSQSRVENLKYGGRRVPPDVPTSILAFLAVYLATIFVVMFLLTAAGLDPVTAFSSAATAVSNVGPGIGHIVGPAGNFAPLPDSAKLILSAAMLFGRLELFTLLVLFDPAFWRW